jgi:SAM-dependent methyltransferase
LAEQLAGRTHTVCDYEGTSYRARFWDGQGREYEDLAERIALRRLLPPTGHRLLELGAGFGRLADLYQGYDQVVLLDYAKSGLLEAQERLGQSGRFIYVAADLYNLPFVPGVCDTVVTVRVLHHLADVPAALAGIAGVLKPGGTYVLEYANKRNLKACVRYATRRQSWSPFGPEPYEFAALNFDFHPRWMAAALSAAGFSVDAGLAVSHFRYPVLKRLVPPHALANLDGMFQRVGAAWKLSPSIFLRARHAGSAVSASAALFCCPRCRGQELHSTAAALTCSTCGAVWPITDGIYDFKQPLQPNDRGIALTGNSDHGHL